MALYFVTGSLGGGKSLAAMSKIDEYLRKRRKVATNMNLNLEYLCNPDNDYTRVMRVPDAPTIDDLKCIGYGSDKAGDKNHGLLVLDELGTWFNARDFGDKSRKAVIKFCIHLRKLRWDVLFLVQDFSMVDKQMRGNITQYLVTCQNSHDFWFFRVVPKFHIATVRLKTKIKTSTWWYRGKHLFPAYDTEQLYFTADAESESGDGTLYLDEEYQARIEHYQQLNGLYSLLPPKYLGNEIRDQIRARHAGIGKGKNAFLVLLALLMINGFLWKGVIQEVSAAPDPETRPQEISELPGVQLYQDRDTASIEQEPQPPTWSETYQSLRITGWSKIGMRQRYTFTDSAAGGSVRDADLADAGIKIQPQGRDQVTLHSPAGEKVTLTR